MGEFAQAQSASSCQANHDSDAPGDISPWGADNDQQGGDSTLSDEISAQVARFLAGDGSMSEEEDDDEQFDAILEAAGGVDPPQGLQASEELPTIAAPQQVPETTTQSALVGSSIAEDLPTPALPTQFYNGLPQADPMKPGPQFVPTSPSQLVPIEPPEAVPRQAPVEPPNAPPPQFVPNSLPPYIQGAQVTAPELVGALLESAQGDPKAQEKGIALAQEYINQVAQQAEERAAAQRQEIQNRLQEKEISRALARAETQAKVLAQMQAAQAKAVEGKNLTGAIQAQHLQAQQMQAKQMQAQQMQTQQMQTQQMQTQQLQSQQAMLQQMQQQALVQAQVQAQAQAQQMQLQDTQGLIRMQNWHGQEYNNNTASNVASTCWMQSLERGSYLSKILQLWKLPPDVDEKATEGVLVALELLLKDFYFSGTPPTVSNIQQQMAKLYLIRDKLVRNIIQIAALKPEVFIIWVPPNFKACILLAQKSFEEATMPDYSRQNINAMIPEQTVMFRKHVENLLTLIPASNGQQTYTPAPPAKPAPEQTWTSGARFEMPPPVRSDEAHVPAVSCEAEQDLFFTCPRCNQQWQKKFLSSECPVCPVCLPQRHSGEDKHQVSIARDEPWTSSAKPAVVAAVPAALPAAPAAAPDSAKVATPPTMDVEDEDAEAGWDSISGDLNVESSASARRLANQIKEKKSTTLMIRNIPKNVKQKRLLKELDDTGFADKYDFGYLPSSFGKGYEAQGNGYAFVNFPVVKDGMEFALKWHGTRRFGMMKVDTAITISSAELQGKEANASKWARKGCRVRNPDLRPFIKGPCDLLDSLQEAALAAKPPKPEDKEPETEAIAQLPVGAYTMPPPGLPAPTFHSSALPAALVNANPDGLDTSAPQALDLASRISSWVQ